MKKLLILLALALGFICARAAVPFPDENLSYIIQYKWGLIQKNAATAQLVLKNNPTTYNIRLSAQTLPWANSIFPVRDTLLSVISKSNFLPQTYTKITHENGKYRRDALTYTYSGGHVYGKCIRLKRNSPTAAIAKSIYNCSATGNTYDMLSIFYYIRTLDYPLMLNSGKVVKATIFSGSAPETITIKCVGKETVKLPSGASYPTYKLMFTFTTGGGTKTSAPMYTWVTTDATHLPVKLVGTLSLGSVRAFLTSKL